MKANPPKFREENEILPKIPFPAIISTSFQVFGRLNVLVSVKRVIFKVLKI